MTEKKKLTPERLMQAKAFYENGVINKDQFIEMTHGQSNLETSEKSDLLPNILDAVNKIELRLKNLEILISELVRANGTQE
tara:strand:- start:30 stop:272 length:243 start_codon:yes stop_codon:yes gene_type:complete